MDKRKKILESLNCTPVPSSFHDQALVAFEISNKAIKLRIGVAEYFDFLKLLADDNHTLFLDVVYNNIRIDNIYLTQNHNLSNMEIVSLELRNNLIVLNAFDMQGFPFNISFTFESYEWNIYGIVSNDEYDDYLESLGKHEDSKQKKGTQTLKGSHPFGCFED